MTCGVFRTITLAQGRRVNVRVVHSIMQKIKKCEERKKDIF